MASLVKELDKVAADHESAKFAAVVNLLGPDAEELKAAAKSLGEKNSPQHVAVVVPNDNKDGPKNFAVSPDAELTVMLYKDKKVVANHAVKPGGLTDEVIKAIVADSVKMLKK